MDTSTCEQVINKDNLINLIINKYSDVLPSDYFPIFLDKCKSLPENKLQNLLAQQTKSPILALIFSLFFGGLGIDRFYLGQIGIGLAKLLTAGGCGIWYIVDLFLINKACKQVNQDKIALLV